jgi:hypothetical protein
MVLLTQHYDTVTAVGTQSKATIMMVPYSPTGMSQVSEQITAALLTTGEAEKAVVLAKTPGLHADDDEGGEHRRHPPRPPVR